ncbi:MAG: NAD(P)H-dependent oxidoreductase subunit E [Legionella sp.]|nr:NAD(P)H-dependent oxidoreductase subunit E [Legionella sp.]
MQSPTIDFTHVFVCVNKKNHGKCCSAFNSESIYEFLRGELNRKQELLKNRKRVKVTKTSCLGRCAVGPNILISPDNIWYTFTSMDDIHEIIDKHLIQGQLVERLINKGVTGGY